jgi:hypothetical protein
MRQLDEPDLVLVKNGLEALDAATACAQEFQLLRSRAGCALIRDNSPIAK